jgi:predicted RNA-binding protein YlxR (DUF448 family)
VCIALDSQTVEIENGSRGPVRTCIGCRERSAKRELLRVVARSETNGTGTAWAVVPDPGGTAPGRGAHLHPSTSCLALAERKRAFARALRITSGSGKALSTERLKMYLQDVTD